MSAPANACHNVRQEIIDMLMEFNKSATTEELGLLVEVLIRHRTLLKEREESEAPPLIFAIANTLLAWVIRKGWR
jgi:hypothetical protein